MGWKGSIPHMHAHPLSEFVNIGTWKNHSFQKEESKEEEKNAWQSVCLIGKSIEVINEFYYAQWPLIVTNEMKTLPQSCDCYKFK